MTFIRPVWASILRVIAGLEPGPTLSPAADPVERLQEILYLLSETKIDLKFSSSLLLFKIQSYIRFTGTRTRSYLHFENWPISENYD
jgi:hypothetical protein